MKKSIQLFVLVFVALMAFVSCEKTETSTVSGSVTGWNMSSFTSGLSIGGSLTVLGYCEQFQGESGIIEAENEEALAGKLLEWTKSKKDGYSQEVLRGLMVDNALTGAKKSVVKALIKYTDHNAKVIDSLEIDVTIQY